MIHDIIIDKFLGYHIKHTYNFLGVQESNRLLKKISSLVHWWAMDFCSDVHFLLLLLFWSNDKHFHII